MNYSSVNENKCVSAHCWRTRRRSLSKTMRDQLISFTRGWVWNLTPRNFRDFNIYRSSKLRLTFTLIHLRWKIERRLYFCLTVKIVVLLTTVFTLLTNENRFRCSTKKNIAKKRAPGAITPCTPFRFILFKIKWDISHDDCCAHADDRGAQRCRSQLTLRKREREKERSRVVFFSYRVRRFTVLARVRSYCRCPHKWRRPSKGFEATEDFLHAEYNSMHLEGADKKRKKKNPKKERQRKRKQRGCLIPCDTACASTQDLHMYVFYIF